MPSDRSPIAVACAGAVGIALMVQSALVSSATYDEVAYLRIASSWWRTGETAEISRMGSPVTFFKLQCGPAFAGLDLLGLGRLVDEPILNQATLLPIVRVSSLWIWLVAFGLTVGWSRRLYGRLASILAAWLFALSPNLLAHGAIATMETPLVACSAGMFLLFWAWLESGDRRTFVGSAALGGLAFSCKFTTVAYLPILGLICVVDGWKRAGRAGWGGGLLAFGLIFLASNLLVTGFSLIPPSPRTGDHPSTIASLGGLLETPMPQDWVGFANQVRHQHSGGPSYLLGERRMTGWWYYYPVALAVKVPLGCWLLLLARGVMALRTPSERRDWMLPTAVGAFLLMAMLGSKRNYGVRYLLPMAPLAIVWISALAERRGIWRGLVALGILGQAVALATIHPHELSFFNALAGGPVGGRRVLADSNLDWGQGLRSLAEVEGRFSPLTVYYFGDTDPHHYGVRGKSYRFDANSEPPDLPRRDGQPILSSTTRFIAVSASLQHGPWGPAGLFRGLDGLTPVAFTDDKTIAIYDLGDPQSH